ncbi:hypothetical protein [Endozoicomonas atrinae]|uniref:hypothetical protein n=1 Tax=Endozoicomonas atrinae TaxID=1333660 RepID=UPI000826F4E9|nr:hypothetical protein [Endozoicomonas atrinae]
MKQSAMNVLNNLLTRTFIFSVYFSLFCTFSSTVNAKDIPPIDYLSMDLYSLKVRRWFENGHLPHIPLSASFIRLDPSLIHQLSSRDYVFASNVAIINNPFLFTMIFPFSVLAPATSASSLTAVELSPDSTWMISGYKFSKGTPVTFQDFTNNHELMARLEDHGMFDIDKNRTGYFLLLDQEHAWGVFDYPLDANITFSRHNELTETVEEITVNVTREVTNTIRSGKISAKIISTRNIPDDTSRYKLVSSTSYPNYDFYNWYHQPSRIVIDFKPSSLDTPYN